MFTESSPKISHKSGYGAEGHVRRACLSALFLAVGLFASLILQPLVPHGYIVLLALAAGACGWLGGRAYGAAGGVLAALSGIYFFVSTGPGSYMDKGQQPAAAMFALAVIGAGGLSGEWRRNRDRLRASREQLTLLLDGVKDQAVFLMDSEGRVATWNVGAQRISGYAPEEILGKPHSVFYSPEAAAAGEPSQLLQRAAKQGSVQTQGWRVRRDGRQFWAEVIVTALYEDDGGVRGYAKTTRDISESRLSQQALQQKEEELRAVVESAPDAVLMVDETGTILFANACTEGMFGYSLKQLLGKKIEMLVPQAKRAAHAAHREAYRKDPHPRPMGIGLDLCGVKRDSSEFPVEISLGPVKSSTEHRFVASVRDISERRLLERELQNTRIQELAQLMIRNLDGRIVQWNAGMMRMYGFSRAEAEGAIAHELLRTTFPIQLESIEAELLRTGFWEGELVHRKKDGGRIFVNSYWVLHRDKDGRPWRVLEASTDVTALKEAEANARRLNRELERQNADLSLAKAVIESQTQKIAISAKMSALGEMAGGMAHEINNPMGIIHARASDLLEMAEASDTVPSRVVVETMEKIRSTASRVTKITLGLRKFARETRFDPLTSASIQEIVDETLSFCLQRFKQNAVDLRVAPIDTSLRLACKPAEISQVLLNLLNNAVDAALCCPEKWVELAVRDACNDLEISITDSGTGIPENVRPKLGQPFFTTKEVGKGTGLGLSISRGIVEAHGGTLLLDSDSKNTRFVIKFPKGNSPRNEHASLQSVSG